MGGAVAARFDGEVMCAPYLLDVEVVHALRALVLRGSIDADFGTRALEDHRQLGLARYAHEPHMTRIWELRDAMTAYDATYVALAEALECPLVTMDARLGRSVGHDAVIEVVA